MDSGDLSDFERVVTSAYDRAYNDIIISEYFTQYHKALNDLLGEGKDVQRGTTQRYKNGLR